MTLQRMEAELVFGSREEAAPVLETLEGLGFDIEMRDWIDDEGQAVGYVAAITTELDMSAFFDWVAGFVDATPGGCVLEAGPADEEIPAPPRTRQ